MKKNKILSFVLMVVFISTLFCGCRNKSQIEKAQEKIVTIGERFLDYELTIDDAVEQLDSIILPKTDGYGYLLLDSQKNYLTYLIIKSETNTFIFDEIKEEIQDIKQKNYN